MPLTNDQIQDPNVELLRALAISQMGKPTMPSHDPAMVQQQMLDSMMGLQRADDFSYAPRRQKGEYGWGSALSEALRPLVSKRMKNKSNEQLIKALGQKGELDKYDTALAEYNAGKASAQKQYDEYQKFNREKTREAQLKDNSTNQMRNAAAMGLQPGTPEYAEYIRQTGGGVTVNTGSQVPAGMRLLPDGSFEPIKGSSEWYKREQDRQQAEASTQQAEQTKQSRIGNIDETFGFINNAKEAINAGSAAGWWALGKNIPESNALALDQALAPVRSSIALGEMERLKSQSAVGATGFGNLSEKELAVLTNARGSLEQKQRGENLLKTLDTIETHYKNYVDLLNGKVPDGYESAEIDGKLYIKGADGNWVEM